MFNQEIMAINFIFSFKWHVNENTAKFSNTTCKSLNLRNK